MEYKRRNVNSYLVRGISLLCAAERLCFRGTGIDGERRRPSGWWRSDGTISGRKGWRKGERGERERRISVVYLEGRGEAGG